jgi:hypothetical protein
LPLASAMLALSLLSGISWVEELIEIAGGEAIFPEFRRPIAPRRHSVKFFDQVGVAQWFRSFSSGRPY